MKPQSIAIILIVLGLAGLYFGLVGFNQKTAEMNIGGMTASATEHKTNPLMAIAV